MPTFTHTMPVNAPYDRLWALVRDARRVAGLFTYIDISEMADIGPDAWTLQRTLTLPGLSPLCWHERTWVAGEGTLAFAAEGGDVSRFDGSWRVEPAGEGAVLTFTVEYEIPPSAGAMATGPAGAYLMGELLKHVCRHVAEEAEKEPR
jgi:hypothetical protein